MKAIYLIFLLLVLAHQLTGQATKRALPIRSREEYMQMVAADTSQRLVSLQQLIPGLVVDMPYGTIHNFTGKVLYKHPAAYLKAAPAAALQHIQSALRRKGLALKVFDAYRPLSVTQQIWDLVHDSRYAANPGQGSKHNRAAAIDLTIIDLKTGNELNMGTAFDNFTDTAHHSFTHLPGHVLANRRLLRQTMQLWGFDSIPTEWWHYQWHNSTSFPVLDLDFDSLASIIGRPARK